MLFAKIKDFKNTFGLDYWNEALFFGFNGKVMLFHPIWTHQVNASISGLNCLIGFLYR